MVNAMENRYDLIYELKSVIESIGKPVSVESGILVRDNKTGLVVIRLTMKNIGSIKIGAVKVRIDLFSRGEPEEGEQQEDGAEEKKTSEMYYAYNDMDVSVGETFGEMTLIPVPPEKADGVDSFDVVVEEVAFRTGEGPVRLKAEPLKNAAGTGTHIMEGTSTDPIHDLKPQKKDEERKKQRRRSSRRDVFRLDRKDAVNDPKNLAGIIIIGLIMIILLAFLAIQFFL
jgi:hypothetical protein